MARSGYIEKKFVGADGARHSAYGKTKEEAEQNAAIKAALIEAGVKKTRSPSMTVAAWADRWLKEYKNGTVSDAWYADMESIVRNVISPSIGAKPMRDVKQSDIVRMYNKESDRSESSLKKIALVTKQIFETAVDNDIIAKDPCRGAKLPQGKEKIPRRTITSFERELTLKTANIDAECGIMVILMLFCGCRPQEAAALLRKDVDLERNILHINKALKKDGYIGKPKSKAGVRDVPIPEYAADFIRRLNRRPTDLMVTNSQGGQLTPSSIKDLWKKFKREMELTAGTKTFRNKLIDPILPDDLTLYCYRHTYCTDLQDAGVPLAVASRLMGHSSIELTAKIYTHHSEESFEDARQKINAHIKGQ